MSVQSRIKPAQRATAVTALAGATPQTGAGNAFPVIDAEIGTLSATVYAQATTSTLTIAPKWQARNSVGAGTWLDVYLPNNAANVAQVTGTGSAVAATRSIAAPMPICSAMEARCVVVTGVETAAAGDEFSVSYNYRETLMQRRPIISAGKIAVTALTGAAPQAINGNALAMGDCQPGTVMALVYAKATTNLLTITGKWQVTNTPNTSGSWIDARLPNAPADVVIVTGTGSAVTSTRYVVAPDSIYGYRFARYVLTSGVGVGGGLGVDEGQISYQHMRPFS